MRKIAVILIAVMMVMGLAACGSSEEAGSGNWKDGKRFEGGASEDDVRSWIEGM